MSNALAPGNAAPEFILHVTPEQKLALQEFRGYPVVLAFYMADWSPVCCEQMALYSQILPEFHKYNAKVFGVSVDSVWSHTAFSQTRNINFPLLADFEPKGDVAKQYGVYRHKEGTSERALFVIDKDGKIFWSQVSPIDENPGAEGILKALERMPK